MSPRACPGPDPVPRTARAFVVPPGAVDTHAHVIGPPGEYPFVAERSYTPPPASARDYLAMLDATGMSYGVLVQVSVHGTDNRLLLQTLRDEPARLRGVAVVPLDLPERELDEFSAAGVAGLRLNVLYGGGIGFSQLASYGALARERGWHLQFLVDARDLTAMAKELSRLPVPFVVDHWGHFPASRGVNDAGFRTLLALARDGAWVKLSGAYRNSVAGPPYADTTPFAQALLRVAPQRCLWGSDWPHVAHWGPMMNVGDLLDLLAVWAPGEAERRAVLVENPAVLFGFPRAGTSP